MATEQHILHDLVADWNETEGVILPRDYIFDVYATKCAERGVRVSIAGLKAVLEAWNTTFAERAAQLDADGFTTVFCAPHDTVQDGESMTFAKSDLGVLGVYCHIIDSEGVVNGAGEQHPDAWRIASPEINDIVLGL